MFKTVIAAIVVLGFSIGTPVGIGSAAADQTDERLEPLFAALQEAEGPNQARTISEAIWRVWFTVGDDTQQAIMNEGRLAMATNRLAVALTIYTRLVDLAPDYAEAWNRRATVYFLLGDLDRSAADVEQVLALEPRHYGALGGLAQIELRRDNLEAALAAFEAAVDFYPLLPGAQDAIDALRLRLEGTPI